jgi:hypothetical protein
MRKFEGHKWWVLTVLVTAPLVAIAAGVPNVFSPGTVISSGQVNDNFKNLADRLTALETAGQQRQTSATVVFDDAGGLGDVGTTKPFTSTGGPLLIVASGSASASGGTGSVDIAVQIDGATIGHLTAFATNPGHMTIPTRIFRVMPAAGSHNLGLLNGAMTKTDMNDYFSVTVIELGR